MDTKPTIKNFLLAILPALLVVFVIIFFLSLSKGRENKEDQEQGTKDVADVVQVNSFEECAATGNSVMESYPRQCRYGDETFTENIGDELEKADLIRLNSPRPNEVIASPLIISGEARGTWFFEGSFPVILTDWDGLIIAEGIAMVDDGASPAKGGGVNWMTEEFVPFSATLEFPYPNYKNNGSLILKKDNPSGLSENDDVLEIPIYFKEMGDADKKDNTLISKNEALIIAGSSKECVDAGIVGSNIFYNENSKTWWIDLKRTPDKTKDGCNPACVIFEETKSTEVNWRCTGLIPLED